MTKVLYHLHIDAARIPETLINWAIQDGGFHYDDFPHQFTIDGEDFGARHLTKYIMDPATPQDLKLECQQIKMKAEEFDLQGFIQAEFIMQEKEWKGEKTELPYLAPPLQIKMRPLSSELGEEFKRHEIHLECDKTKTSDAILEALKQCGFHVLDNTRDITFTCSGHPKELSVIKERIEQLLDQHPGSISGKLVYEATAFWSLHGMNSAHLPTIVGQVIAPSTTLH